ncbi:hypothetical protein [Burkholderia sp. LMG 32019]|uniref:hypothetical protein n=1 Tax=Burkholderia sp. LMG 32019 TaxID=3158173 RepID=UPI003C2E06AC
MTYTAYSPDTGCELDVQQLLQRCLGIPPDDPIDITSALDQRAVIAAVARLECPSCFVTGATVVREGRSRNGRVVRQAHFRFVGAADRTAHHPLCDFYDNDRSTAPRAGGVDFGNSRSELTRAIGKLVCVGIERAIFAQSDMRALRKWNFELRCAHQFRITRSSDAVTWCMNLVGHRGPEAVPFQPRFGDLPDFDWRLAAARELSIRHQSVIALLDARRSFGWEGAADRAIALMKHRMGATVFDPTPLESHYARTIELARFASRHWQPLRQAFRTRQLSGDDATSAPVLALCALLLSISRWDVAQAASTLTELIAAPAPQDTTLGNFIGLNPFHDVPALRLVKAVQEATASVESGLDYEAERSAEVDRMKAQYTAYRAMRLA